MSPAEPLYESDPAAVARYLQLRSYFHDHLLTNVDRQLRESYELQPTRRIPATMTTLVLSGYIRPGEGEIWPVVFLGAVDITLALFIQLAGERLAGLGTVVNGPRPVRHRHWEELWGWETSLSGVHPQLFGMSPTVQESTLLGWYLTRLEWLVRNGLMRRKPEAPSKKG
jgi:hypothetical protein